MATTLTKLPFTRWTVTGFSGPQPLAGTEDRAAEAYAAMCAADWTRSDGDATVPAHDFDAASPAPGDAYRQTWGYDADARTERSACGAVCYSIKIPADALTGTACSVSSVAASLFGDRWIDGGAIVSAILSADATPPPFSDFLSASVTTAAMLAPTPATKPAGAPANWRNLRDDSSATLALTVGASAAAYLHICLRVADYLHVYGAWHDGGAMLDPATLSVTFSRDVSPDAASVTLHVPLTDTVDIFGTSGGSTLGSAHGGGFFSIGIPNLDAFHEIDNLRSWTLDGVNLRRLTEGLTIDFGVGRTGSGGSAQFGHRILPYGDSRTDLPAASLESGTIWVGYRIFEHEEAEGVTMPSIQGAGALYRLDSPLRRLELKSIRRVNSAVPLGTITVRLLAYSLAHLPPPVTYAGALAYRSLYPVAPCAAALDFRALFDGRLSSVPFSPANMPFRPYPDYVQTTGGGDPYPGDAQTTSVECRLVGRWLLSGSVAVGAELDFTEPLVAPEAGYVCILLAAIPVDFGSGSSSHCSINWPINDWRLVEK